MKSTPKFLPWIGAALLAVAGVLQVMMAIRGGYDAGTPPGVMLVLASVIAVFAAFAAFATRNAIRLRAVARENPAGFTSNVVTYASYHNSFRRSGIS